jgi:D-erythro-7,8-dihydroneopterin triphosphate epimerase
MLQELENSGVTQPISLATINIKNLRLRTFIGFNPEERTKKQDVVLNIQIRYRPSPSVLDDEVEGALNYKTITKAVIRHVEEGRFLLLEKLVADVLATCSNHADVMHASVTIDKPHALRFAESVSLTLEYEKTLNTKLRTLEKAS